VCLGAMAWQQLAGRDALFDPTRPKILAGASAMLYPMYHPGYVIRGSYDARRYARDFRRLGQHLRPR
jgi:uracil-DNA glycosylase